MHQDSSVIRGDMACQIIQIPPTISFNIFVRVIEGCVQLERHTQLRRVGIPRPTQGNHQLKNMEESSIEVR
jgi:hypothetical protein